MGGGDGPVQGPGREPESLGSHTGDGRTGGYSAMGAGRGHGRG